MRQSVSALPEVLLAASFLYVLAVFVPIQSRADDAPTPEPTKADPLDDILKEVNGNTGAPSGKDAAGVPGDKAKKFDYSMAVLKENISLGDTHLKKLKEELHVRQASRLTPPTFHVRIAESDYRKRIDAYEHLLNNKENLLDTAREMRPQCTDSALAKADFDISQSKNCDNMIHRLEGSSMSLEDGGLQLDTAYHELTNPSSSSSSSSNGAQHSHKHLPDVFNKNIMTQH